MNKGKRFKGSKIKSKLRAYLEIELFTEYKINAIQNDYFFVCPIDLQGVSKMMYRQLKFEFCRASVCKRRSNHS